MKPTTLALLSSLVTTYLAAGVNLIERTGQDDVPAIWPFNPHREQKGMEKSPSQGQCYSAPGLEASHKCKDEFGGTRITSYNCWEHCWCDKGIFKCDAWGGCSAGDMGFWCQCPQGGNKETNCLGFMTMCYCSPEDGFKGPGAWGDGTAAAAAANEARKHPGEDPKQGLVTDGNKQKRREN